MPANGAGRAGCGFDDPAHLRRQGGVAGLGCLLSAKCIPGVTLHPSEDTVERRDEIGPHAVGLDSSEIRPISYIGDRLETADTAMGTPAR